MHRARRGGRDKIQGDERSALAAKALVDACGRKLPAPWKRTLEAFARRDREAAQNELAVALSEKPQIFEDACEGGVRAIRGLGAAPVHGKRDYVTGACNFGEGGMASAAEFREAEGGVGLEETIFAPALFRWLVKEGHDREVAREVTRALAGIPADIRAPRRPDILTVPEPGSRPRADVAVAIDKRFVLVNNEVACAYPRGFYYFKGCGNTAISEALAKARPDGAQPPRAAVLAERTVPFQIVHQALATVEAAGFERTLIFRGIDTLWVGVPLTSADAGAAKARVRIDDTGVSLIDAHGEHPPAGDVERAPRSDARGERGRPRTTTPAAERYARDRVGDSGQRALGRVAAR